MHRYVNHTADEGIEAEAPTLEELYKEILKGLFEWIGADKCDRQIELSIEWKNEQRSLVELLEEVLYICEEARITPSKVEEIKIGKKIELRLCGEEKVFENPIKAVTYHRLKVEKKPDGVWFGRVIFDI